MKLIIRFAILGIFASVNVFATQVDVDVALESGNIELAEQAFNTLSEAEQSSVQGQISQARILYGKDETKASYDLLESLLDDHEQNVELQYQFGLSAVTMAQQASIFSKFGYAKDGLHAWENAVMLDPQHAEALSGLIGFHLAAPSIVGGDTDEAVRYANMLIKSEPVRGYAQLAVVYWQTEKPELAEQTLAKGISNYPQSSQLYFTRAISKFQVEDWVAVRSDLNSAIQYSESEDERNQALYQLGKLSVESGEQLEVGVGAFQQILAMEEPYQLDWSRYRLAQLYVQNEQLAEARSLLSEVDVSNNSDLKKRVSILRKKIKKLS